MRPLTIDFWAVSRAIILALYKSSSIFSSSCVMNAILFGSIILPLNGPVQEGFALYGTEASKDLVFQV